MAEKLFSYADKQVMDEVGSGGGSGSGTLIVHVGGTPPNFTFDKTYNEIVEAAKNGMNVMLFNPAGDLESCLTTTAEGACLFTACGAFNGGATFTTFYITPDNTVGLFTARLTE